MSQLGTNRQGTNRQLNLACAHRQRTIGSTIKYEWIGMKMEWAA